MIPDVYRYPQQFMPGFPGVQLPPLALPEPIMPSTLQATPEKVSNNKTFMDLSNSPAAVYPTPSIATTVGLPPHVTSASDPETEQAIASESYDNCI